MALTENHSSKDSNPAQVAQIEPPKIIHIDITPERYQEIKASYLKKQHGLVRPHLLDFIKWLKDLNPLDVFDCLEKNETVKTVYDQQASVVYRMGAAAARGLLKSSRRLRNKANKAFNVEIARLVLRFENREVYDLLAEFDPDETYLKGNIRDLKEILGLEEKEA